MNPIISVIIPLYNKEKSIGRTLCSVENQTEQRYELIIVNDESTDHSLEIVQKESKRAQIINQKNSGASEARNRGVEAAKSDLVAFLDADDEWDPSFLEMILKMSIDFPDADVFATSYYTHDNNGKLSLPSTVSLFDRDSAGIIGNYLDIIHTGFPFNQSSFAVKKKALQMVGGFPKGIKFGEDADTWVRLSLQYRIAYINKPLSIYHLAAENRASNDHKITKEQFELLYTAKKMDEYLRTGEIPGIYIQAAIEYVAKFKLPLAQKYLYFGDRIMAKELLLSCYGTKKHKLYRGWLLLCSMIPPKILNFFIKIKHNTLTRFFYKN